MKKILLVLALILTIGLAGCEQKISKDYDELKDLPITDIIAMNAESEEAITEVSLSFQQVYLIKLLGNKVMDLTVKAEATVKMESEEKVYLELKVTAKGLMPEVSSEANIPEILAAKRATVDSTTAIPTMNIDINYTIKVWMIEGIAYVELPAELATMIGMPQAKIQMPVEYLMGMITSQLPVEEVPTDPADIMDLIPVESLAALGEVKQSAKMSGSNLAITYSIADINLEALAGIIAGIAAIEAVPAGAVEGINLKKAEVVLTINKDAVLQKVAVNEDLSFDISLEDFGMPAGSKTTGSLKTTLTVNLKYTAVTVTAPNALDFLNIAPQVEE